MKHKYILSKHTHTILSYLNKKLHLKDISWAESTHPCWVIVLQRAEKLFDLPEKKIQISRMERNDGNRHEG